MLEEQKTSNAACQAFEQHRFKGHLCVHCFKPKAAHAERAEQTMEAVKIVALDNNINMSQENVGKSMHQKYDVPKVIFRNQNNLQKDARGRGEKQMEKNNRKKVKEKAKESGPQIAKRDGHGKPSKMNVMALNIPLDVANSSSVDNKLSARGEPTGSGIYGSDSCPPNGSGNMNEPASQRVQEPNGNFYPNSSLEGETDCELSGSFNEQLRRALRPVQKAGSPSKSQDRNSHDPELPEFVKVAKNLRHIQSSVSASVEVHSSNNNNHSVLEAEETLTDLPDLPNVIGSDACMEDQQRLVDSKSKLPPVMGHFVTNSQATLTGHETLPKNIGKSRPSIKPLTNHRRQTSDPALFVPSQKEEIVVNLNKETDETTENVVVRNSQLSSDVYFGKPPAQISQKHATGDEQEDLMPRYGHVADCVTIISVSGEVSHHYSLDKANSDISEHESGASNRTPVKSTNPYKVVHLNENQSEKSRTVSSSTVKSRDMPSSSSSSSRMSQDMDEGVGLAQQEEASIRSKDPSARFSRRNVALVDGIYTSSQFNTDSGINDSMESSDSSEGPKLYIPPAEGNKRNTPPYPIILHDEPAPEYRKTKRNSGQYKVPIFILPKGYDSSAGWNAAKRNSAGEVVSHVSPSGDSNIDYLQPKEKPNEKETAVTTSATRDESDGVDSARSLLESKKVSLSNDSLMESRRPSRSRSKTHPVVEEELSNSPSKQDHDHLDFTRSRLKRVAPRPPSVELIDQVFSRERDDRLDSLPHRSPPPPPLSKKDSKQSLDRSSSDLSDDTDIVPCQQASNDDKKKVEGGISGNSGKSDQVRREMSPNRRRDFSPERHREMSPLRNQHESRNATPAKKESNFRARLREFSPTGRRDLSPSSRGKPKDVSRRDTPPNAHQPARRVASPPPPLNRPQPLNLPNATATQDAPAVTTKSKKSKLPWKRKKKRDEPGSPEREFNSEEVEKWLKNSFSTAASTAAPEPSQRNSLERLEVINAYRGEPTVAIKRVAAATNAAPASAATPTTPTTPTASTPSKRDSLVEDEEALARNAANNASKRRAPMPPVSSDQENTESSEETILLQKSYSLSPTSRRKTGRGNENGETEHLYENLGASRAKFAPQKPARRRQRNRTTGFEDMPSRVKRMAPKTPERVTGDGIDAPDGTAAVEIKAHRRLFNDAPLSSSPPLKSALRSTMSEPAKTDAEGNVVPKRPVRIIAPEDELVNTEPSHPTVLRSDYKNLALVPQVKLDSAAHRDAGTQMGNGGHCGIVVNAEIQCSLTSLESSNLDQTSQRNLLSDVNGVHVRALTQLSRPMARGPADWTEDGGGWKDQVSSQPEPRCCSAGSAFYSLTSPSDSSITAGLMVCCNPSKSSQVLHMADITKSMSPQPNLISVSHATKDTITIDPSLLDQRKARESPVTSGSVVTALVITDSLPIMNVAHYVTHNAEKHEYLPDIYEHDVAMMLLQLCQGLCQLQSHHMCLESLKLDHLLLTKSGLPGGGQRLVINHLMGAEVVPQPSSSSSESDVVSKLEQKCHEFDVGILVYEFLHLHNPFSTRTSLIISDYTERDLPNIPVKSPLSSGLHVIACKLLAKKPEDRLTCSQAASLLQCLVWGPPSTLYSDNAATPEALSQALERWLVAEQASTVSRIALSSILGGASQGKGGLSLSDQLQCQYLADLTVDRCKETMKMLYGQSGQPISVIATDLDL